MKSSRSPKHYKAKQQIISFNFSFANDAWLMSDPAMKAHAIEELKMDVI